MDSVRPSSTFLVRMWPESSGAGEDAWRGSVDDVLRARRIYFTNLGTLCEFIVEQRRLGVPAPDDASAEER